MHGISFCRVLAAQDRRSWRESRPERSGVHLGLDRQLRWDEAGSTSHLLVGGLLVLVAFEGELGNRATQYPNSVLSARQGRSGSRSQSAAANNASKSSGHHRTNNACLCTPHTVEANRIVQTRSSPAVLWRSIRSFALTSVRVCHCMLRGLSSPPQASGRM